MKMIPTRKELVTIIANEIYLLTTCISWDEANKIADKVLNALIESLPDPIKYQTNKKSSTGLNGIIKTLFKKTGFIDNSKQLYKILRNYNFNKRK